MTSFSDSPDHAWDAFSSRLFDQNAFAVKLGLDNIRRALDLEGHPETTASAIVVGGTNGKGGVAAATAGILQSHGLRVGLYTSPHLVEVRERFRVDGAPLPRDEVLAVGRDVLDRYGGEDCDPCLTFFELTTLMAGKLFADRELDVVVWEVGLGGRLDAVNAIEPALTIVTNVDLDHEKYLGETLREVAAEKAALRRPGIPLVLGPQTHDEVRAEFDFPETIAVPSTEEPDPPGIDWQHRHVSCRSSFENQLTAMAAARRFLGDDWEMGAAVTGLARTSWPGRLDPRRLDDTGTRFLLDAAHNPAGAGRLMEVLEVEAPAAFVIGAMEDKDHAGMFAGLNAFDAPVYIAEIDSRRAAAPGAIEAALAPLVTADHGPARAMFERATEHDGFTCVFGSVYLLGEWFDWAGVPVDELATYR